MHYYTFYAKDYASKAGFLEPMEDLAYRRMLDLYYLTEKPLPESVDEIALLIRMRSHNDCIATVLRYFFELTASGYINKKVETILDDYHQKSVKAKASADARWAKVKAEKNKKPSKNKAVTEACEDDANALRTECEMDANYKPLTINQELNIQEKPVKFVFKKSLVDLGADPKLVDDWIVVRKTKKASNTETAFNLLVTQFDKSGLDINTILKICIHNSWSGFKLSWLENINISDYQESKQLQKKEYKEAEMLW